MDSWYQDNNQPWTDIAQICLNGHVINDSIKSSPELNKKFCPDCGEATIIQCHKCNANIPGEIHYPTVLGFSRYKLPIFCSECGKPYPWTENRIKAAKELASELDELTSEEKKILDKSIDEISKDNMQATVGATRFKKLMLKVGSSAGEVIRDVITDIASETAKKILFPK